MPKVTKKAGNGTKVTKKNGTKKKTTRKATAKAATKKAVTKKAPATRAKKPRARTSKPGSDITFFADQRRQWIEEAAYLRAEARGFVGGDPTSDWLEAESEVDARITA
jgi:hypothetical protein